MNAQQRYRNRINAQKLADNAVICPQCGEHGKHWVYTEHLALGDINEVDETGGFFICPKFYSADGQRIYYRQQDAEAQGSSNHDLTPDQRMDMKGTV